MGKLCPLAPQPYDLLPEALIETDGFTCVPMQLSALLNMSEAKISDEFDDISPNWRDRGLSAINVLTWCEKH